jgi:hypothetical protein
VKEVRMISDLERKLRVLHAHIDAYGMHIYNKNLNLVEIFKIMSAAEFDQIAEQISSWEQRISYQNHCL